MKDLDEIKNTPIIINPWMIEQVGVDNSGPYKQAYPEMLVKPSNEPLVNVSEFGVVSSDYYLSEYLSGNRYLQKAVNQGLLWTSAYLRRSHVKRLQLVDSHLRSNELFLHIQSGWRDSSLQQMIKQQFAEQKGEEQANRLYAPVIERAAPPPHATGAAFDLEIRSLVDGERQEIYCTFDNRQIYGAHELEAIVESNLKVSEELHVRKAVENRRILFHCLCSEGVVFHDKNDLFTPHPGECWHFGDGDPLSAYLNKEPFARYGLAVPPFNGGVL